MEKKTEEIKKEIIERPYTLRKLKDRDLIPLLGILRKLGLKEYKEVITQAFHAGECEKMAVYINVALSLGDVIIANLEGGAAEDIFNFWSALSGIPVEDMKEAEFGTLPLMIYDTFSEAKNCSFFKVLAKLL